MGKKKLVAKWRVRLPSTLSFLDYNFGLDGVGSDLVEPPAATPWGLTGPLTHWGDKDWITANIYSSAVLHYLGDQEEEIRVTFMHLSVFFCEL